MADEAYSAWLLPDDVFRSRVESGHQYEIIVALALRARGLVVDITPIQMVRDHSEIPHFADQYDIAVGGARLEIKSQKHEYHGPHDFPFPWALVNTRHKWEAKRVKPVATVLISQQTLGMCVIPTSTRPEWRVHRRFEPMLKRQIAFYEVARDKLRTFRELANWLEGRSQLQS